MVVHPSIHPPQDARASARIGAHRRDSPWARGGAQRRHAAAAHLVEAAASTPGGRRRRRPRAVRGKRMRSSDEQRCAAMRSCDAQRCCAAYRVSRFGIVCGLGFGRHWPAAVPNPRANRHATAPRRKQPNKQTNKQTNDRVAGRDRFWAAHVLLKLSACRKAQHCRATEQRQHGAAQGRHSIAMRRDESTAYEGCRW